MKSTISQSVHHGFRIIASLPTVLVAVVVLAGCQTTQGPLLTGSQVVVVTPQDQAARLIYTCPNGRTLDITRVQGNTSALVVIDGKTIQLPRDSATTNAERYSNRIQTLTLFGTSASLDVLGRSSSGPCTIGGAPAAVPGYATPGQQNERPPEFND